MTHGLFSRVLPWQGALTNTVHSGFDMRTQYSIPPFIKHCQKVAGGNIGGIHTDIFLVPFSLSLARSRLHKRDVERPRLES